MSRAEEKGKHFTFSQRLAVDIAYDASHQCDLQRPICSRCQRVKTTCQGIGQRRFKFVTWKQSLAARQQAYASPAERRRSVPIAVPGNESSLLAQALVAELRPADDLRYSVTWLWGPHMIDLPCRIGTNRALDAALSTLLQVHQDIRTFSSAGNETSLLSCYNKAIQTVRWKLQDPAALHDPETLCAIMLLSACAPRFEGPGTVFVNPHGRGAAELLRIQGFPTGRNPFERSLYSMLRDAVAVKAVVDPNIKFTEEEWAAFERPYSTTTEPVARLMRCAAQLARLMASARVAVAGTPEERQVDQRAAQLQHELEQLTSEFQRRVYNKDFHDPDPIVAARAHAQDQRNYNQALNISAQLLCIRRACMILHPHYRVEHEHEHEHELEVLSLRMLRLAEDAKAYRPLGANWIVITLMTVWCAVHATRFQAAIEHLLDGWRAETLGDAAAAMPRDVLEDLLARLSLGRRRVPPATPRTTTTAAGSSSSSMRHLILVPAKTSVY